MGSIHNYFATLEDIWEPFSFSPKDQLEVSVILEDTTNADGRKTVHETLRNEDVEHWLQNTARRGPRDETDCARLLRIAWISHDSKYGIKHVDSGTFDRLEENFDHGAARKSLRTSSAGVGCLRFEADKVRSYYFCYNPKIAITWSRDPANNLSSMICIAEQYQIDTLRDLLNSRFIKTLAHAELTPALLCAMLCSREIEETLRDARRLTREVEVRTGFHTFASRKERPASGDLLSLSAKMSGCSTKLASGARKLGVLQRLHSFVIESMRRSHKEIPLSQEESEATSDLKSGFETIQERAEIQSIELNYLKLRAQTQRDALFHLMEESHANVSHEMAKDSRLIALASHKDSASMKVLSVVTLFFLPGTFVSSLFSMPLFNWGDSNTEGDTKVEVWWPRLLIYISVTGPLMLFTFSVWAFWMLLRRIERRKQRGDAQEKLNDQHGISEVSALTLKRMSSSHEAASARS